MLPYALVSGKYFNKGVKALDDPDLGHVVRETPDKIIVFGKQNKRYDIPISEIQQVGANILIGLDLEKIERQYSADRDDPLPTSRKDPWDQSDKQVDLGTYEGKYPHSLFNKGVRSENEDHVGHVMKETNGMLVVFGHGNDRFDIPKSVIIAVGMNVIVKTNFPELFKYKVDMDSTLPTGETLEKIDEEAYPEYYHGPKEDEDRGKMLYPK
jgi:sporulation protein YlmC with PRC-barrel domain